MTAGPFSWTDRAVRQALALPLDPAVDADLAYTRVATDTRRLEGGELFVALTGDRFDAHDFLPDAVAAGAAGLVVARAPATNPGVPVYRVSDTLAALGRLAHHARQHVTGTVVGITGSLGKTTVKELLRAAVAQDRSVYANPGNLNNRVGLPLSLLDAPLDAEVLLLEMGTNEPGEIAALTAIAEPHVGVVTTVAEVHLEKLGSRDGVLQEKLALVDGLRSDGRAVLGDEPPELAEAARGRVADVQVAGTSSRAHGDLRARDLRPGAGGTYRFSWQGQAVRLQIPGRAAVSNALVALATARLLGVPAAAAAAGVGSVQAPALRGEVRRVGPMTVLADCYNASPRSVLEAVETLNAIPAARRKVAILGSMLELGEEEEALHRQVLAQVLEAGPDLVVAAGAFTDSSLSEEGATGPTLLRLRDPVKEWETLAGTLEAGDAILLKASRGERLERLLPLLEERFGAPSGGSAQASSGATRNGGEG